MQAALNYRAGAAAEDQVASKYERSGFDILARRFRRREGEIDLIAGYGGKLYFIEVKKSRDHDTAAARITPRQTNRIKNAALRYLAELGLPLNTAMRFDAALVDEQGHIKVIPNAFA